MNIKSADTKIANLFASILKVEYVQRKAQKFVYMYSKASRCAVFGSRKKPCSSKPHFVRFIPMY